MVIQEKDVVCLIYNVTTCNFNRGFIPISARFCVLDLSLIFAQIRMKTAKISYNCYRLCMIKVNFTSNFWEKVLEVKFCRHVD